MRNYKSLLLFKPFLVSVSCSWKWVNWWECDDNRENRRRIRKITWRRGHLGFPGNERSYPGEVWGQKNFFWGTRKWGHSGDETPQSNGSLDCDHRTRDKGNQGHRALWSMLKILDFYLKIYEEALKDFQQGNSTVRTRVKKGVLSQSMMLDWGVKSREKEMSERDV